MDMLPFACRDGYSRRRYRRGGRRSSVNLRGGAGDARTTPHTTGGRGRAFLWINTVLRTPATARYSPFTTAFTPPSRDCTTRTLLPITVMPCYWQVERKSPPTATCLGRGRGASGHSAAPSAFVHSAARLPLFSHIQPAWTLPTHHTPSPSPPGSSGGVGALDGGCHASHSWWQQGGISLHLGRRLRDAGSFRTIWARLRKQR